MYLIIGIWGGERRVYAAVKFFLFTMAGSLLMLIGILWLAWTHGRLAGTWSFRYEDLIRLDCRSASSSGCSPPSRSRSRSRSRCSAPHLVADAHVEAPTGRSVNPGRHPAQARTYGFLRFALPCSPGRRPHGAWLLALAVIAIIYGALVSWVQPDMKKLVAYSSVAHSASSCSAILVCDLVALAGRVAPDWSTMASRPAPCSCSSACSTRSRHTKKFEDFGGPPGSCPSSPSSSCSPPWPRSGRALPRQRLRGEFLILLGAWFGGLPPAGRHRRLRSRPGGRLPAAYAAGDHLGPLTKDANRSCATRAARGDRAGACVSLCSGSGRAAHLPRAQPPRSRGRLHRLPLRLHAGRDAPSLGAPRAGGHAELRWPRPGAGAGVRP